MSTTFERFVDPFRARATFDMRYALVKQAIMYTLKKDGLDADAILGNAMEEAEVRTGIRLPKPDKDGMVLVAASDSFPTREQRVAFDAFVHLTGGQKPVGVWSILQMDTLGMFDAPICMVNDFPELVTRHPELSFNGLLTKDNILYYESFVTSATSFCESLKEAAQDAIRRGDMEGASYLGVAEGVCRAYQALSDFASGERKAAEAREAAEKERLAKEAEQARKDRIDRGDFKPLKDADRWLDRKDAWDRYGRTA